jgi:hypothetical protein
LEVHSVFLDFGHRGGSRIYRINRQDSQQRPIFGFDSFDFAGEKFFQKLFFQFDEVRNLRTTFPSIVLPHMEDHNLPLQAGKLDFFTAANVLQFKIRRTIPHLQGTVSRKSQAKQEKY